jgi:hypothetical protein
MVSASSVRNTSHMFHTLDKSTSIEWGHATHLLQPQCHPQVEDEDEQIFKVLVVLCTAFHAASRSMRVHLAENKLMQRIAVCAQDVPATTNETT